MLHWYHRDLPIREMGETGVPVHDGRSFSFTSERPNRPNKVGAVDMDPLDFTWIFPLLTYLWIETMIRVYFHYKDEEDE